MIEQPVGVDTIGGARSVAPGKTPVTYDRIVDPTVSKNAVALVAKGS